MPAPSGAGFENREIVPDEPTEALAQLHFGITDET